MKKRLYPLTMGQKEIAHAAQLYPNSAVNNIGGLVLIEDELDFNLMEKVIKTVVSRNDGLRLRLVKYQQWRRILLETLYNLNCKAKHLEINPAVKKFLFVESLRQKFVDNPSVKVGFVDFTGKTAQEMDDTIAQWNAQPIDVFNSPMYEFTMIKSWDGRCGVFSKIDHLATDAWMSTLLCREIVEVYYAMLRGEELPPAPITYLTVLEAEEAYLKSPQYQADHDYWMSLYPTKPHATYISGHETYPYSPTGKSTRKEVVLDPEMTSRIHEFAQKNQISPVALFYLTYCLYISHYGGNPDVTFLSPVMLRSTLKEKRTSGPLINSLLIHMVVDEKKTFLEACKEMTAYQTGAMRHIRYPLFNLMSEIYQKYSMNGLFDCSLSYQAARIQTKEKVRIEVKWYSSGTFSSPFFMSVTDLNDTNTYNIYYEYQTDIFTRERVDSIHESLMYIIQNGITDPDLRIEDLFSGLSEADQVAATSLNL